MLLPVTASVRSLPRIAHVRAFHSPFVVLNAANHASTAASTYEKQHDSSPEPHLSSSGTLTYVVSEPDPADTPYQVPSGAYPASASYRASVTDGAANSSLPHSSGNRAVPHKGVGTGHDAAVRNTAAPGETGRRDTGV